jgi:hypothetical protein
MHDHLSLPHLLCSCSVSHWALLAPPLPQLTVSLSPATFLSIPAPVVPGRERGGGVSRYSFAIVLPSAGSWLVCGRCVCVRGLLWLSTRQVGPHGPGSGVPGRGRVTRPAGIGPLWLDSWAKIPLANFRYGVPGRRIGSMGRQYG